MKIKFNSNDAIPLMRPLNKAIENPSMIIVVKYAFQENNKFYPQVSLHEFLCEL